MKLPKILKNLLIALLTTFICVYLSHFFDSSNYLAAAITKPKIQNSKYQIQPSSSTTTFAVNPIQNSGLLKQSQEYYQTGQYNKATKLLNQAIAEFQTKNDKLNQAIASSNLSLAYQKLGQWQEANQTLTQSIKLLQNIEKSYPDKNAIAQVFAQTLDVRGNLELSRGEIETALATWQEAAKIYQQLDDTSALIKNRINQAQAMQRSGNHLQARYTLNLLKKTLDQQANSAAKAEGLLSLGNVLQTLGYFNDSQKTLKNSLAVAKQLEDIKIQSNILISLGNLARAQRYAQIDLGNSDSAKKYTKVAIQNYQQAAKIASIIPTVGLQADLNQLRLLVEQEDSTEEKDFTIAKGLLPQIRSGINKLPPSRTAVNVRINFAQTLSKMIQSDIKTEDIARILVQAVEMAQNLKDKRSESYALGTLAELYERTGQLSEAKELGQQALLKAESISAIDIAYQWNWLIGRIFKKQSNLPQATAAYSKAYKELNLLRDDLVAINPDMQFSFRETVEPVYREYVDVLLQSGKTTNEIQSNPIQARQVIESLQLAELNNFFRSPCVQPKVDVEKLVKQQKSTAFIYPIILENRLETITSLSESDNIYRTNSPVSKTELESTIKQLQKDLPVGSREPKIRQNSQKLYKWLIEPIESTLINNNIKTLVFILDGSLQNIPMAVLYDQSQQKYLIEKYAITLTPSLQLFEPKALEKVQLSALVAGIEPKQVIEGIPFPRLPNVEQELKKVQAEVQTSEELLNQKFTKASLRKEIQSNPFSIVHIATHGQFSSDPEETYITLWQEKLRVEELDSLLRRRGQNPLEIIELLVLSACKTAEGDKRAALGLAGVAVRAGARSTLATLWTVDDRTTSEFMGKLYQQLNTNLTKAEAIRSAQLSLLSQQRPPSFWAPYVLVGNWL